VTRTTLFSALLLILLALGLTPISQADEQVFGYVKGAEPLPKGANEFYAIATQRSGKGSGHYRATDYAFEFERGFTDRLAAAVYLRGMSLDTSGILIDAYLPGDRKLGLRFSGLELETKYNFLSPASHSFGLSLYNSLSHLTVDPHSGHDKSTLSLEMLLLAQKYFMDGQLIWAGNFGIEATRAKRSEIANLPPGFEWPTEPEMEVEVIGSTGLSYRFAPNWYIGGEALYEQENETEVGLERWSLQAGPVLHYGAQKWWATFIWLPQLRGGGETYPEQGDFDLHLVEKTKTEYRLKFGINF